MTLRAIACAVACAVLSTGLAGPSVAQTPAPAPASSVAPDCAPRTAGVGGIGRASVVAFRGPVFGGTVCALIANLVFDAFTAKVADAPDASALVAASLGSGGDVTVPIGGTTIAGVGPYVIAPGGAMPSFGSDTSETPRVVLAFSGGRVVVIGTSPVALVDLARILRTQPELFGADAIERAVVLASGAGATVSVRSADGVVGAVPATGRVLSLVKSP